MAVQKYPVPCACGHVHEVSAGDAGRNLACACGKTVDVPSLVKLKASVGQSTVSADFELDQMIGTNTLPVEVTCGVCGVTTRNKAVVLVVCEEAEERAEQTAAKSVVTGLLVAVLTLGLLRYVPGRDPGRRVGRDVAYRLPIRVCEKCAAGKWTRDSARAVLERTPLYARLLDKYPHAKIGTPA